MKPNLSHPDALVRAAAGRLVAKAAAPVGELQDSLARLTIALFTASDNPDDALKTGLEVLESTKSSLENKLIATRVVQLALGDLTDPKTKGTLYEGYSFREPVSETKARAIIKAIKPMLEWAGNKTPTTENLDRELARVVAGIGVENPTQSLDGQIYWMTGHLRRIREQRTVQGDLHYLTVLSRMRPGAVRLDGVHIARALLELEVEAKRQQIATIPTGLCGWRNSLRR